MSRLIASAAAIILMATPALAEGRSHVNDAGRTQQSVAEELAPHGTSTSTSTALSNAARNATQSQQGTAVTQQGASQTGILDLNQ